MARNRSRVGFCAWGVFLAGLLACLSNAQAQTWNQIGTLPPGTDLRCAYFWDATHGVVGGVHCIYTYTAGVWRQSSYPEEPDTIKSLRLLDGFNLYAASGTTCVWISSDRGATWQKTSALLPKADDINVGEDGLIHGINENGTGMTQGTTYARINPNVSNSCIAAMDRQNTMEWSTDGGVTWTIAQVPPSFDCGYPCAADTCSGICYVLTHTPKVELYQSTDQGKTWFVEHDFFNFAIDILEGGNSGVLYVQGKQNVYRSLSGGVTWSSIGGPGSDLLDRRMFTFGQYNRFLIQMDSNLVYLWDGGTNYHPTGPMPTVLNVGNVNDTNCTFSQLTVTLKEHSLPATVRILANTADSSTIQPADTTILLPAGTGTVFVQYRTSVPLQQRSSVFYFVDTVTGTYECGQFEYTEEDSATVQLPTYPTNILSVSDLTDTGCTLPKLTLYFKEVGNPDTVRIHAYTDDGLSIQPADTSFIVPVGKGWFPLQYDALAHPFQYASTYHFEDTVSGEYKCGTYKYVTDSSILVHLSPPPGTPRCWLKTPLKFDACTQTRIPLVVRAPNICDSLTIDSITWTNNSLSFQLDHQPPETLGPNGFDTFWVTLSTPIPGINNNLFYVHATSTVLPHSWDTALYLYALASAGSSPRVEVAPKLTCSNCAASVVPIYLHALSCDSVEFTSCTLSMGSPILYSAPLNFPLTLAPGMGDTIEITFPPQGYSGVNIITARIKGRALGSQVAFDTTVQIRVTLTNASEALVPVPDGVDLGTINLCDGTGEADTTISLINLGCDTIIVTGDQTVWPVGWSATDPSFPDTLAPKDSFDVHIYFNPTGAIFTNFMATYGFEYEGGKTGTAQISLTGQAIIAGQTSIAMSIPAVNFGTFSACGNPVADTTITITNTGCDSLTLSDTLINPAGGFTIISGNDTTLGPNQSITFAIHFADSVAGVFNGAFNITGVGVHGGNAIDTSVSLTANITPAIRSASVNIASIDFGTTTICEERDSSVTITNTGCDTLHINSGSFSSPQFSFDTAYQFPIAIPPDSTVSFPIFTHLDTTGHPATINATLNFTLDLGVTIPAVSLNREVTYPGTFSLSLASEASAPIRAVVPVYVLRAGTVPSQADEVDFHLIYNDNLLGNGAAMQPDIKLGIQTRLANGLLDQAIAMQPSTDRDTIATLKFQTYLTKNVVTAIQLTHQQFIAAGAISPECVAQMDTTSTSSNFTLELNCQDSIILADWNSTPPFSIESIQPNPAGEAVRVVGKGQRVAAELDDALGRQILPFTLYPLPFTLDLSNVPSGIYYLRFSSEGYVQTRRISVER